MKRLSVLAATAVLVLPAAAPSMAQDASPLATTFENTVLIDVMGFWEGRMYFESDGTYTMTSPDGEVEGDWVLKGNELCTTQSSPAMPESCSPYEPREIGETWEAPDAASGAIMTITIVEGREGA